MSDLQIRTASRQGVRPLIGLYAESGAGKTFSALLLARGFVGPSGKMVLIDTESGRGELYSDVREIGGYEVLPLSEPFSPARYVQAIDVVERSGASIGILDSASHEWEGISGVLDMAAASEAKSGKGLHNWVKPKMEHALFLQRLLRSTIPWLICVRAKYKTRQGKDDKNKTVIIKDDVLSPIQAEDFIFEMTLHGWIDLRHCFHPTKIHHSLAECLPNGQPITLEHGRLLAQWCAAPGTTPTKPPASDDPRKALLTEIRAATKPIHKWTGKQDDWDRAKGVMEGWLVGNGIIGETAKLSDLPIERLQEVLNETKAALTPKGGQLL